MIAPIALRSVLHSDIEYVKHGFPCICPSKEGSWPVMRQVYSHELEWFKAADGFQLWFYDPGGCMCERCRRDLCGPLVRQAEEFSRLAWGKNPCAEFQVSMWPIWEWEARLGRRYGVELLDRLRSCFAENHRQIAIVDSAEVPGSFLDAAKGRGFRTQAFLFSADVETPFVFLNPQFGYLRETAARIAAKGYDGGLLHSLSPGSKMLSTLAGALALWNPRSSEDELAQATAVRFTGEETAARQLAPVLRKWEKLLLDGNPGAEAGGHLRREVEKVMSRLPEESRRRMEPILDSARAIEVLAAAAAAKHDSARQRELAVRFRVVLEASPTFRAFAAQGAAEFPHLVEWMTIGWKGRHF